MKYLFLFILLFYSSIKILGQIDSVDYKSNYFSLEVGHSTSIFLNSKPLFLANSNSPLYKPTFFKMKIAFKNTNFIFIDYKNYNSFEIKDNWHIGEIWLRKYDIFDLGFGRTYYLLNSKLKIQPLLMLSIRPNGTENVYVTSNQNSFPKEPLFNNYNYKSFGFGFGFNLNTVVYRHFSVGFETHYNYFIESKKLRGRPVTGFEVFENNYKVNRNIITPIIKLCYDINCKRRTKPSL